MTVDSIPQRIQFTGYLRIPLNPNRRDIIFTNSEIFDEQLSMLEFFAEVYSEGISFVKIWGHRNFQVVRKTYFLYRGFIRQARLYYRAALEQSFRISALNYYYAFLNLVKAYLVLCNPTIFRQRKIHHGLVYQWKHDDFAKMTLKVDNGIFRHFYKEYTGVALRRYTYINLAHVLGYCTDVSREYSKLGYGELRSLSGQCMLLLHNSKNEAWSVIAIERGSELDKYPKTVKLFNERFQKVDLEKMQVKELFKINPFVRDHFDYYESRRKFPLGEGGIIPVADVMGYTYESLKKLVSPNLYRTDFEFFASLPYRTNNQFPMREAIAIYLFMYFLSSLVRYNPDALDKLLETKHMHIIKRFLKNSPITFLRYITACILKENCVVTRR